MIGGSSPGRGWEFFSSPPRLGPHPASMQRTPMALSLGGKRPGREAGHSPPSSAEVKACVKLHLHSPNTPSWHGAHFKHRSSTFTFYHEEYWERVKVQLHTFLTWALDGDNPSPLVPIGKEAGWAPELVWTWWWGESSSPCWKSNFRWPGCSLLTILTELPWLFL
jgi:hypothetical protein